MLEPHLDALAADSMLELGGGAGLDHDAVVDDDDLVGETIGLFEVLRREQRRDAAVHELVDKIHMVLRLRGSRPVVGSSRKSTDGLPVRLMAMSRRRRIPPEYVFTI